jgi:sugar/nucleoside kinase (ribokinase family)
MLVNEKNLKVVGIGACVMDTLINCDKYPTEDTKQKADGIFVAGGGPVGNAMVVMSKLGIKTEVLGAFANDEAGKYLINDFVKYGVGVDNVTVLDGATSFVSYIVLSESTHTRTCVFDRGSVPDEENNIKFGAIDDATVLHLDGNYLNCAIASAKYAKSKGVKVSLDAGGLYANIQNLLPLVDILIPSAEFALGITKKNTIPDAMQELYEKYKPEVLVVTDGSNGGYYWENGKAQRYDSVKVNAIDTNGAGDTFHGAFVTAYCNGKTVKQCCDFASKVAGYKCTFKGARTYPLNIEIAENL